MIRGMMAAMLIAGSCHAASGTEANPPASNEDAIRKSVEAYVAAYNKQDAKALAALWAPEAVYINPDSGEQAVGREAVEHQFEDIFLSGKDVKLEANTESVRFLSPNVAVEQGTARLIRPDQGPEESAYTAVYVKHDGVWLLDRVTEEESPVVISSYEHLKGLEWMIGTWVDEDDESKIETTCAWTKNQNFITRSFTISIRDRIDMAGMQFVGWDPATKQIRSWVFDSDGGFGEGVWSKKDNRWYIHATGTTPDGKRTSAVNIITYVNDDAFTWQSVDRFANGELLPNVDEIPVVRQASPE